MNIKTGLLLGVCLALSACGSDNDRTTTPEMDPDPGYSATPDQAISRIQSAYSNRNINIYDSLLHQDFGFYFAQEDVNDLGVPSEWVRAREMGALTAMFEGGSGSGARIVQSIDITLDPETSNWDTNVDARFEGTQRRDYRVDMQVHFLNGDIAQVTGIQNFYVREAMVIIDGEETASWQVQFWQDTGRLSGRRAETFAVEGTSWGGVKASF